MFVVMVLSCIQPSFFPWKGYFHMLQRSDVFVFHDNIQYDKQSWRNRNIIKTRHGKRWLTVPVKINDNWRQNINEVRIDTHQPWQSNHLNLIKSAYLKAPYFGMIFPILEEVYATAWERISDLDIYATKKISEMLGINTQFVRASDLSVSGHKTDRLIQICKILGAHKYISGPSARNYIEEDKFIKNKIELEYMDYYYPEYPQLHGTFDHFVSILDVLFHCGDKSYEVIWS